jgi:chromosome segregation and condensation protein ScpB
MNRPGEHTEQDHLDRAADLVLAVIATRDPATRWGRKRITR